MDGERSGNLTRLDPGTRNIGYVLGRGFRWHVSGL